MRYAEASKTWERLRNEAPFPSRLSNIKFAGIAGLHDGEISIESPITMICGLNGVGKSLLLRLAWAALDWKGAQKLKTLGERLGNGDVSVEFAANNASLQGVIEGGDLVAEAVLPENINVTYVDVPRASIDTLAFFSEVESIPDLINGVDPMPLDSEDLATLRYITGKAYSDVKIYELDVFEKVRPFFSAIEYGFEYNVKSMSLGEITCFYMLWLFKRATSGAFYFLDEPEIFISPIAQSSMMDYIARITLRKRLSVTISSHSVRMMSVLSGQELILMVGGAEGSTLYDRNRWQRFLYEMGFSSGKKNIIFVEDRLARVFLSELLRRYDLTLSAESEVLDVGGHGNITELRKKFPTKTKDLTLIGVYDQDIVVKTESGNVWPSLNLPGDASVENIFRHLVTAGGATLQVALGRSSDDIAAVNARLAGADPHDWLEEFGSGLEIDYNSLVNSLLSIWLLEPSVEASCREFVVLIRTKLGELHKGKNN